MVCCGCDEQSNETLAKKADEGLLPHDMCACTPCRYPNGAIAIVLSQLLLFVGFFLGAFSMLDCQFVIGTALVPVPLAVSQPIEGDYPIADSTVTVFLPEQRRGLGFFFNETIDNEDTGETGGRCPWHGRMTYQQIEDYVNFLGPDWQASRGFGMTATPLVILLWFFWLLIFPCVAQVKAARYLLGAILILIVFIFQCVSFHVLQTHFCDEAECAFGRGAGLGVGAVLCYFFAGLSMLLTKDYPGKSKSAAAAAAAAKEAEEEPKEEAPAADEEEAGEAAAAAEEGEGDDEAAADATAEGEDTAAAEDGPAGDDDEAGDAAAAAAEAGTSTTSAGSNVVVDEGVEVGAESLLSSSAKSS